MKVLISCLSSKQAEMRCMGASALWALLHNNQRVRSMFKRSFFFCMVVLSLPQPVGHACAFDFPPFRPRRRWSPPVFDYESRRRTASPRRVRIQSFIDFIGHCPTSQNSSFTHILLLSSWCTTDADRKQDPNTTYLLKCLENLSLLLNTWVCVCVHTFCILFYTCEILNCFESQWSRVISRRWILHLRSWRQLYDIDTTVVVVVGGTSAECCTTIGGCGGSRVWKRWNTGPKCIGKFHFLCQIWKFIMFSLLVSFYSNVGTFFDFTLN